MSNFTLDEFKVLVVAHKPPDMRLEMATVKYWYDEYFKWYTKDEMKKFFEALVLDHRPFTLESLFEIIQQYLGYLLHIEVKKALLIKEKFTNLEADKYPNTNLPLPIKRAWLLIVED
jgi:hypothetical protein